MGVCLHPLNNNSLTAYVRKKHISLMPRKLPPLNALRAFEAAGRHQSFSRAAQELGVSHSSISRHVRGLEHRLKARLFRDLPRGVELTRDGLDYLARLTPVFDAIAEASDALEERPAGVITVNCEPVFATKWLIPALGAFNSLHPEVDIRLEASQELADVTRYATDVAIRFFNSGAPDRPAEQISNASIYPYASPDLIARPLTSPDQLRRYPLLKDRNSDTWGRWFALAGGDQSDAVPVTAWRMHAALALESAIAGQGVILCSSEVAQRDVTAGRLIRVFDLGFQEGGYYLVLAQGALRRKAVRVFQDWILATSRALRV
jgi:LysR family transcriptional regulator, glycine cleavage system transcriptional activator